MDYRRPNGETIRRVRLLRGLSQEEITKRSGPTSATLVALEHETKDTRPSTLRKLARALEVDPAIFYLEPDEAEAAVFGPLGLGEPVDPADELLATLRDAEAAYRPDGIPLDWSADTFDQIIARLGETSIRLASADMRAGRQARAIEILQLFAQTTANLEARKALLKEMPADTPVRPPQLRPELADPGFVEDQLDGLAATA